MRDFRRSVWLALQGGAQPPPELVDYQQRQAFWQHLGISNKDDLEDWPPLKIERYLTIMEIVTKWQQAREASARHVAALQNAGS
jgi:hypothetical protein